MPRILCLLLLLCLNARLFAQTRIQVKRDTVSVVSGELVINNSSKNTVGYLYNAGNGVTKFKPVEAGVDGKGIQFRVGVSPNFPIKGDSSYINSNFIGKQLKVWRNGIFQYRDSTDGILLDTVTGKLMFHPYFKYGDRVYIEAFGGYQQLGNNNFGFFTNVVGLKLGLSNIENNRFTLRWGTNISTLTNKPTVIGLGSSTLAGYHLNAPFRLGDKIDAWLTNNTTDPVWANLAVSGYTSQQLIDQSFVGHNIYSALQLNPDFMFISLPGNDFGGNDYGINLTVNQALQNYKMMDTMAANRGIQIFWETTQPRGAYSSENQVKLRDLADSIRRNWPDRYVEGFDNLVRKDTTAIAAIRPEYENVYSGLNDHTHLNSDGNQQIAGSLFARWTDYFQPVIGVGKYVIDSSRDGVHWGIFDEVLETNAFKKSYSRPDTAFRYFRARILYNNGQYSANSGLVHTDAIRSYDTWGRILIDLGGDSLNTINGSGVPDGKLTPIPDKFGRFWNNWTGVANGGGFRDGATINYLVDTVNNPTNLSIKLIGDPTGSYASTGKTVALNFLGINSDVGDYPSQATMDNMFVHSTANAAGVSLRIMGLVKSRYYKVKLWGARIDSDPATRVLETKLSTQDWSTAQSVDTRYQTNTPGDYNKAITYVIGGMDSVTIDLRVASGSSLAHLGVIDIKTIPPPDPNAPVITLRDTVITLPKDTVKFTPTIVTNGSTITSYSWALISGPSTPTVTTPAAASTSIKGLTNGYYKYKFTITTSGNSTVIDTVLITVNPDNGTKKTMRMYFSKTKAAAVPGWTNAFGLVYNQTKSFTDSTTMWTVSSDSTGNNFWTPLGGTDNASDNGGNPTGNNSGTIPDIVLSGYWFNTNIQQSNNRYNLTISGLNASKTYSIKLAGSRLASAGNPRYASWRIKGDATEYIQNAIGNTGSAAIVNGSGTAVSLPTTLAPDANGKIYLGVFTPSNTSTYGIYSYINCIILQEN